MNITNSTSINPYDTILRKDVSTAMGVIGLCSCISSLSIISMILFFNLHKTVHTRLVLQLCVSDFIQGLAGVSSLGWIHRVPQVSDSLCVFQTQMFQIGDVASAISSFFIVLYVWANTHYVQFKWMDIPGQKYSYVAIIFVWSFTLLFDIIAWLRYAATSVPIFTPVGFHSWCWMSEKYPVERMMLHYTWILLICFLLFGFYVHIIYSLNQKAKRQGNKTQSSAAKKKHNEAKNMIGFPIVYLCCFIPLGIERLVFSISDGRITFPPQYVAFAICIFVSNGIWNSILYGYTRKLFHKVKATIYEQPSLSHSGTISAITVEL